jgi:hypothetical protein
LISMYAIKSQGKSFKDEIQFMIESTRHMTPDELLFKGLTVFYIDPERAAVLLEFSTGNRSTRKPKLDQYVRQMSAGKWLQSDNDNTISFDTNGRLVNGHHRLEAIIKSGVTLRTVLRFGRAPEAAILATDSGACRNVSDQLTFQATPISQNIRAAIRIAELLASGNINMKHVDYTAVEMQQLYERYRDDVDALGVTRNRFPASFWGTLLYAYRVNPSKVRAFSDEVVSGEGIVGASYRIREYMIARQSEGRGAGGQYAKDLMTRTMQTLQAYLEDRSYAKFGPIGGSHYAWFQRKLGSGK